MSDVKEKSKIWNVPNALTIFRCILVIPFVILLLNPFNFQMEELTASVITEVIFIIASLTDLFDGKIARKYNLITNFGKFADPLADKLLVCSAMICLIDIGRIPAWIVVIIIAREFIISGFRLVASDAGVVIAASYWGKIKTVTQMVMVILMIGEPILALVSFPHIITDIIMYLALVLTLVSLVDYLYKNRKVLG
ncbi:MAG: CDP-diacylglycerol--glycerol-3-phosphate 3-phosphatidyltransferase [Lachnospiraceae bacterium]|nr:CDP-diacylglycerol--glycerol-3-phosphate 3-phosphatidyltransferase [Lachnospiraceae bacterium]